MVVKLAFVPRAFLRIFHRDEPDSSHCSVLGLSSPCFGGVFTVPAYRFCSHANIVRAEPVKGLANPSTGSGRRDIVLYVTINCIAA
jgi:hypothetical protein